MQLMLINLLDDSPDRWSGKHISASSGLGIDYDVLTFIDGPRKCLGYRMGTLE